MTRLEEKEKELFEHSSNTFRLIQEYHSLLVEQGRNYDSARVSKRLKDDNLKKRKVCNSLFFHASGMIQKISHDVVN